MIKYIKNYFNSTGYLQKKSSDALSVFNETINNLVKLNEKIKAQSEQKNKAIDYLKQDVDNLNTLEQQNNNVISKINNIIN